MNSDFSHRTRLSPETTNPNARQWTGHSGRSVSGRGSIRRDGTIKGGIVALGLLLCAASAGAQNALTNGVLQTGTLAANTTNTYTLAANAGDTLIVRVGRTGGASQFNPWLRVYGPGGTLLASDDPGTATAAEVTLTATNAGTYSISISDGSAGGYGNGGPYLLNYLKVPGDFVVAPGDEGGTLINGALNTGTITNGDLDAWTFTASRGDNIVVGLGELTRTGYFNPWLRVYGPDGALLASDDANTGDAAVAALTATNGGTFTIVVSDGSFGGFDSVGTYQLKYIKAPGSFVVSPGDEGGALTNGALDVGAITNGELDAWSFTADTGENVVVRAGVLSANSGTMNPWLRVYGPDGALVSSVDPGTAAGSEVALTITNGGTFTVVVSDGSSHGYDGDGTYQINLFKPNTSFVVSPGDQGGTLTNGALNVGEITAGDLDEWSFPANAGDSVVLRVGELSGDSSFRPWLRLYAPDGTLMDSPDPGFNKATEMAFTVTNAGTYTAVVSDGDANGYGNTGTYALTLAQAPETVFVSPGDQGGAMTNGVTYTGTNSLGDLDVWSFYGTPGDSNVIRMVTTNMTPWLRLYGPSGALVQEAFGTSQSRSNALSYVVTNAGNYTLVTGPYYYLTQAGGYTLKQSRVPPDLMVPANQMLNESDVLGVGISAQDPDQPDKPLTFALVSAPSGVALTPDGNTNATLSWATTEATGPSTNTIKVSVTDTVNGTPFTRTNSFTVVVNEINQAPVITGPGTQIVNELAPLSLPIVVTDVDLPPNPLTFRLVSPPDGMTINPNTGVISWTPTESQGPSTNLVTVIVTDSNPYALNAQHLSDTNSFLVIVHEVNHPPVVKVPANQTINELTTLNDSASATDSDLPPNPLTFSLVSPPTGMTINPDTGAISWTPTEKQGPSTNVIRVVVTDFNPAAVNAQHLSDTNSFVVTVKEVNTAPVLGPLTDRTVNPGQTVAFQATATDTDWPPNTLTFSLINPPTGAAMEGNGLFNWRPGVALADTTNVVEVRVADNGVPVLTDTKSFTVIVNPLAPVQLTPIAYTNGQFRFQVSGTTGPDYVTEVSTNLTSWTHFETNLSPATPFEFDDTNASSFGHRVYRVQLQP